MSIEKHVKNNRDFYTTKKNLPTGALDSETAAEIFGILKKIQEDGKTIIIVTHDPVIAGKCERTIHIVDGKNTCPDGGMGI